PRVRAHEDALHGDRPALAQQLDRVRGRRRRGGGLARPRPPDVGRLRHRPAPAAPAPRDGAGVTATPSRCVAILRVPMSRLLLLTALLALPGFASTASAQLPDTD